VKATVRGTLLKEKMRQRHSAELRETHETVWPEPLIEILENA